VLGKVRIPTHRGNGSAEQPTVGLSGDRLALVERYMIDAEEAEARAQSAAKTGVRPAEQRAEGKSAQPPRAGRKLPQRAPEEEVRVAAQQPLHDGPAATVNAGLHFGEAADQSVSSTGRQDARSRKALVKAERRAAKHAARVVAAMEKKEARERKALAKAAARREAQARKALGKSIARP
jgi:hypothetical protein